MNRGVALATEGEMFNKLTLVLSETYDLVKTQLSNDSTCRHRHGDCFGKWLREGFEYL